MMDQLPVLLVMLPLIAAPLCLLLSNNTLVWCVGLFTGVATLVITGLLWQQLQVVGAISYHLGGWLPPWGIEYRLDALNILVLLVISGIAAGVMLFAHASVQREIPAHRIPLFYASLLLVLSGFLGIVITGDAFNMFIFFEIAALASYALISMGSHQLVVSESHQRVDIESHQQVDIESHQKPERRSFVAAFQYFIMGTLGATFLLIGVGLLYLQTGTLNMVDLAQRIPPLGMSPSIQMAFAFIILGISLKLALFPLHLWLPDAYRFAPSVVTVILAALASKVAFYVLLRFSFDIFGATFSFDRMVLQTVLIPLALAAILVGSIAAIYQLNIKSMMAWSSVASIGYMVLGGGLVTHLGIQAGLIQLFNHALIAAAMFMALGCVWYRLGSVQLADMAGLGKRMPFTMAAFLIAGLGLIGTPLTAGFISKWYLLTALFEAGWWVLLPILLIAMVLAIVYVWRVVEVAYFQPPSEKATAATEVPKRLLIPTWLLVAAVLYFGVDSSLVTTIADQAATLLLDDKLMGAPL